MQDDRLNFVCITTAWNVLKKRGDDGMF